MSQAGELRAGGVSARDGTPGQATAGVPVARGSGPAGEVAGEPRLVVPEGLLIDDIVRERLERQLLGLSPEVDGVVAELDELPPGASCRVHAEWRSLEPASALTPTTTSVRGVALLRPGVPFEVVGETVEARDAALLVDPGAVVHDPHRPPGPLRVASELGRPPFPRRPVVVFLALEPDARLAEWARKLANGLLRRDVEARLALPVPSEGLHLARPCLPCEDSIRALAPDVVVALDAGAAARASHWCGSDRSTVLIELAEDLDAAIELVPWQISRAEGRLRARISRRVDPTLLAPLVLRLCAGPHPMPPTEIIEPADKTRAAARDIPHVMVRPATLVLAGALDDAAAARLDGLVDYLGAEGFKVAVAPLGDGIPHGARSLPLVVLAGVDEIPGIDEILEVRREARRPTVLDVGPGDLLRDDGRPIAPASLAPEVARVALGCGMVSAPAGAVHRAARELGARTLVLPTLLTRTHTAALRRAGEARTESGELVIGWRLDAGGQVPSYADAVAESLGQLLADNMNLRVHAVGPPGRVPASLRRHERVLILPDAPESDVLAAWAVHLFTPTVVDEEVADDLRCFVEASCAGVPSVLPVAARRAIDGHPSPQLVVRDPQDVHAWLGALRNVLGPRKRRARRVEETVRHGISVAGSAASRAVAGRFVGWAMYEGDR